MLSPIVVALSWSVAQGVRVVGDSGVVPRLEPGTCIPAPMTGERVDCRLLVAWENREHPGGALVRVPVRIFHSRSSSPAADPILFMVGGPGVAVRTRSVRDLPFLDQRDFIILDQRGTHNAQPALECAEAAVTKQRIKRRELSDEDADRAWVAAASTCANRYRTAGIDLNGYTTRAIAEDVEDLRKVLGVREWNLYGLSYSTRVMLTVMRDHPATVRSVVLDSPLPPESRFDEVAAANVVRSLNIAIDACQVSAACARDHPHIRTSLETTIRRLDENPVWVPVRIDSQHVDSIRLTGAAFAEAVSDVLNDPRSIPSLPTIIERAALGDVKSLAPLFADELQLTGFTMGMRMAVWCSDVIPFEDPSRIAAQRDPRLGLGGNGFSVLPASACAALHLSPPPPSEGVAVRSAIPTLILSGELDPNTPTPWAYGLLANLSRAFVIVFPGASHGPGNGPCGTRLIAQFVADPSVSPGHSCLTQSRGLDMSR